MSNNQQNQYIQPDTEDSFSGGNMSAHQAGFGSGSSSTPGNNTANSGDPSSFFSFTNFTNPKVDLSSTFKPFTSNPPGNNKVKERQYTGGDTLDEPVLKTLTRDLSQIGRRLAIVIWPVQLQSLASKQQLRLVQFAQSNGVNLPQLIFTQDDHTQRQQNDVDDFEINDEIEGDEDIETAAMDDTQTALIKNNLDWDLWGPLIFSLVYSVSLGLSAPNNQTNQVFSGTFTFIWLFSIVIGLNIQLLGGNISFMSAISASGYSLFPIVVGLLLSALVIKWKFIRMIVMLVLCSWSIYLGVLSLKCSGVLPGKVLLAIYPIGLMYAVLGWLCVIT